MTLREHYGPWALVTGASDGIGRAIALELAAAGLDLVLVARREEVLRELADEIRRTHMRACHVIALDLGVIGTGEELDARTAGLDVGLLVAAAGFGTSGGLLDIPLADELAMVDVNCRAVVEQVHVFGPRLAARPRSGLVLLSSLVAFQGVPRAATYAATKAFVQTFAEGVRHELGAQGCDVLAVAPGPVHSGFADRAGMTMSMGQTPAEVARGVRRALQRRKRGTVRPGFLSKLLEASLALLPRFGRVHMMRRIMASMTRGEPSERRTPSKRLGQGTDSDRRPQQRHDEHHAPPHA